MKKIISLCLCCCLLLTSAVAVQAIDSGTVMPLKVEFINVGSVSLTFFISGNGQANIQYTVSSNDNVRMVIKTYIEKRYLGIFWTRVDIPPANDEWTDKSDKKFFMASHSATLKESGTYRAVIEVWIGSDSLTKSAEFQYDKSQLTGDINSDGRVTAADARLLLRFAAGLQSYSSSQKQKYDVNGDGRVTSADARIVLRIAASL